MMNINMHNSDSPRNELEHNGMQPNTMIITIKYNKYDGTQAVANTQKLTGCCSDVTGVSSLKATLWYLVVLPLP